MTEAGQRQVPVEELLGRGTQQQRPLRAKLGSVAAWRDWNLPLKLAAVTLVPIALALLLGVSVLSGKADRTGNYQRVDVLMVAGGKVSGLLDAVQRERTATAVELTKGSVQGSALKKARKAVNGLREPVTDAAKQAMLDEPGIGSAVGKADGLLGRLATLRKDVDAGKLGANDAIKEYKAFTHALIDLQESIVALVGADSLGGTPQALRELGVAKEEVSLEQALVGVGAARGSIVPSELAQVRTSEVRIDDRMRSFNAVVTTAERTVFGNIVSQAALERRSRMSRSVLGELGMSSEEAIEKLSESDWAASSGRVFDQLRVAEQQLSDRAVAKADEVLASSRTSTMVLAVGLGLALLVAVLVVFVITRHLLSSLRILRRSAMSVAEQRLPDAVRSIQEGKVTDTSVEPVPVLTHDEIGQVARAFDAVHSQALKLAAEQAGMRTAYSSVFVNLSRRSQSLVQRQLQLIERLERDEQDADQLAILFQLDHLATRMRRNNENLMMLSGSEAGRRSGRPVSTADVLRAAVSEIEQYQRVVVQTPPTTKVVGHAASDLMRLLAELLENATAFSPPETHVTVTTGVASDGSMTIDVLDKGIGMDESEVDGANARMLEASSLEMVTSRRMGLFVVGRLAAKHGIKVRLHGGKDIDGVRASVIVPEELVLGTEGGPLTSEMPIITDSTVLPSPRPKTGSGAARNGVAPAESPAEVSGTALFNAVANGKQSANSNGDTSSLPKRNGKRPATEKAKGGLPSGKDLFQAGTSPLSDWWNAAADTQQTKDTEEKPAERETTPIFDQMLSAWFRTEDADAEGDAKGKGKAAEAWELAADENFRTVAELAKKSEAAELTEAGLPRRQRGEQLLPGSATPDQVEAKPSRASLGRADRAPRDPQDVRSRLSGFQRGVQRGKHQARHRAEETPAPPAAADETAELKGAKAATDGAALPGSNGAKGKNPWEFSSDAAWAEAQAVASGTQAPSLTGSGLPRRRRGEQLMPGNAAAMAPSAVKAPQPDRDPEAMRSRLSGFQQGVRRARKAEADAAPKVNATNESTDSKSQNNGG